MPAGSESETPSELIDAKIDHLVFTGSVPVGREVDMQLRARGVTTVGEALRGVPGVAVAATGSYGALASVFVRGGGVFSKFLEPSLTASEADSYTQQPWVRIEWPKWSESLAIAATTVAPASWRHEPVP